MLSYVEQRSIPPGEDGTTPKVWVDVQPSLAGLELRIPAWSFYWPGGRVDLPATAITLTANPSYALEVRLYVVPTFDGSDNYHLDEVVLDGAHLPTEVEPFTGVGPVLILWGIVPAAGSQAELCVLRHVAEAAA